MAQFLQYTGVDAIDQYLALIAERPHLVAPRPDLKVVTDRESLIEHHQDTNEALGLLIHSIYGLTVVDLVESGGMRFPYVRLLPPFNDGGHAASGVAVLATTSAGQVVLIESLRHATGQQHLEIPRGYRSGDEDPVTAARRELREETGYLANEGRVIGTTMTDSGLTVAKVAFVTTQVVGEGPAEPEAAESISAVRLFDLSEVARAITNGEINDSFTIQAFGLLAASGELRN